MRREKVDVLIVGGGAAGLAAAISATESGAKTVLLERDRSTGGVLNQCIHNGFGLHVFKEELTGPEFMERLWEELKEDVIRPNFTVLEIKPDTREVITLSEDGIIVFEPKALVMSTGARERPLNSLRIPGSRVAGIYTAGVAQKMVNIYNRLPGKKVLIVGSGDIGLIMARRLKIEGMDVVGVVEIMPEPGGLIRNVVQCLEDFNIPLWLSHTVIEIHGKERLSEVVIAKVDENRKPIDGTEKVVKVDTLVTSVGLIPQNELIENFVEMDPINRGPVVDDYMRTSVEWIFAAGNNVAIHDLVDFVYDEGKIAGMYAARYALGEKLPEVKYEFVRGKNVGVMLPQRFTGTQPFKIYIRPTKSLVKSALKFSDKTIRKFNWRIRPSEMIDLVVKDFEGFDSKITVEVSSLD
ncbi:tRNA uridine 5-carboxymethylaminomethyl modification enzyme GidA [Thermosipho africanus H17ap60334]|uniref:NAD(P)/FAD-dependent oxidoreductase n=1 Tax=Thermosipho africanus TaxID=2421 RepID=UPI00028D3BB2|nr:FAD-dependent oxidoreductase [Thermosipho africanus]EKF48568.1 tRNA uridine 5-carboxymethylaminomethyl modification enzyme GidA [Thermosipho africanus H17ap60334]